MSLRDLIDSCQSVALANKLSPNEEALWQKYCREFSKRFYVSLIDVQKLPPEMVLTELFSDYFSDWNVEEKLEDILDMIGSLSSPDYDIEKERAVREELRKIEEEEKLRIEENRPVHDSLVPKKFGEKVPEVVGLPKSGGINFDLLKRLQNDEKNES